MSSIKRLEPSPGFGVIDKHLIGNRNESYAKLIIDQLVRQGVRYFCLSPGSRSTPLALAAAEHPEVTATVHFDERGTGFHALGYAKAAKHPAAVIVTSGSAVGNLFPAVMEASYAHVPMILLTADRPPELRDVGANQTADHVKIFGEYARWSVDLPCPTDEISPNFIGTTIAQAVFRSLHAPRGPVHLNCMFREPLSANESVSALALESTRYEQTEAVPSKNTLEYWAGLLSAEEKGVIVVGSLASKYQLSQISELARTLNWPIFADIFSGLRSEEKSPNFIPYYDLILKTTQDLKPSTILHFGDRLISKTLQEWLSASQPAPYFLVADYPNRYDPKHQVTHRLACDPALFTQLVLPYLTPRAESAWIQTFQAHAERIAQALPKILDAKELTEPGVAHYLAKQLTKEWALFFSNSMPVRDGDLFLFPSQPIGPLYGSRGLSGIDGNIATAIGIAQGAQKPTLALLGDLAFLHDLNSLALLKKAKYPVVLLVINNSGGAIFSFLPVAARKEPFEEFFAAAHGYKFEKAAALFDIPYSSLQSVKQLEKALHEKRSCVLEMTTDRSENHAFHQEITKWLHSHTHAMAH